MTRAEAVEQAKLLQALINIAEVSIILNTFVSAFKDKTIPKDDGMHYLHGNFNLGGTVSGRLSSSKINLQNLPSTGSKYAPAIKECFAAPPGWIMAGADFSSLEDKISALTTKDPNKLRVYTDGFDGHNLRAFSYFSTIMPDIKEKMDELTIVQKFYSLIQDSGEIEYVSEAELKRKGIKVSDYI